MKISINQLRLELADIEQSHLQLNTFFWGDFPRAVNEENINYPLMASYFPSAGFLDNQTTLPITIVIADKIYDDYTNLNDVESDTIQICRDVFNIMNKSTRWQLLGRVESCSLTKFIESNADVCAGYVMTINFTLRDSNSICDLPMSGYDFDQVIGASCLPVQVYRNGVLVDTVASGGTYSYTTDAFTYTIKNTDNATLYSGNVTSNLSVTIQDSTVENSDASYTASVLAEGSLVLPDITVNVLNTNDEIVNTETFPSVQDVDISAPNGIVNIKKFGDVTIHSQSVPSGSEVNYEVANNEITVNGANDFEIKATDSLNVVLKDSNGSTLTPNSVTPNSGLHKVDIVLPANVPTYSSAKLMKTGQTTSYATGDDGDLEIGRGSSFFTLISNNPFGNTNRFTDELGGTTYANNIVIDWSTFDGTTVLGYKRTATLTASGSSGAGWTNAISGCAAISIGTYTSGWRLANLNEWNNVINIEYANPLGYAPFTAFVWTASAHTSSTYKGAPSTYSWGVNNIGYNVAKDKNENSSCLAVRIFTVTGTTLT